MSKITIETVKNFIEEYDTNHECQLLSTSYINSHTPLDFKCNICNKTFQRDYIHLIRDGGRFRCPTCGMKAGAKKLKYTKDFVKEDIFNKSQYKMIGEYIDASHPVLVECSKGHRFNLIYSNYLIGHSGCKDCANQNLRGKNHWNYQSGGHQEIMAYMRDRIKPWKRKILSNGVCDISGTSEDLVVHHLHNFSSIVREASKNTNIPLLNKISDYYEREDDALQVLANEVIKLNQKYPIVVLSRDYHLQFHQRYGLFNNTEEQYKEFKNNIQEAIAS